VKTVMYLKEWYAVEKQSVGATADPMLLKCCQRLSAYSMDQVGTFRVVT